MFPKKYSSESQADKLLKECRAALSEDLMAAGPEEVKQHPTLRSRDRLLDKIDAYFKRQKMTLDELVNENPPKVE